SARATWLRVISLRTSARFSWMMSGNLYAERGIILKHVDLSDLFMYVADEGFTGLANDNRRGRRSWCPATQLADHRVAGKGCIFDVPNLEMSDNRFLSINNDIILKVNRQSGQLNTTSLWNPQSATCCQQESCA